LSTRIGVLGGTFDPVHAGHLILGEAAREQLELDLVLYVPTGYSWRKPDREITPSEHRVAMTRLAIEENATFEVSTVEVDRPGPSYTDVTLEEIGKQHAGAELFFILGYDALADLPNWKAPARIVEQATLAVAERVGREGTVPLSGALPGFEARLVAVRMPLVGISASDIRRRVAAGRSIRYLTPDAVREYIAEHGLYRTAAGVT
jgi:nicotinate-nucleotide adenylyltransferase